MINNSKVDTQKDGSINSKKMKKAKKSLKTKNHIRQKKMAIRPQTDYTPTDRQTHTHRTTDRETSRLYEMCIYSRL